MELPKFDYGGSMPLTEAEYSSRKKTIRRVWPAKAEDTGQEISIFSDEQLTAVATFQRELPSRLSDSEWPHETKSAYMALCDELGVPIEHRDLLWETALVHKQETNLEGE